MRWRPSSLPLWLIALSALLAAAVAAACDDSIPAARPPTVDSAPLEDAAERVQAAASRLEAASAPQSDAIIINKDALRLLALLSQLQIELGIIDALINPPRDVRPSRWPLEPEDGAALGFASTRLFWIHHQLSTFASPTESLPIFQDEEFLALLAGLQGELQIIGRSAYAVWKAHEAGEPAAPATPPLTLERTGDIYQPQTRLDQLIEAVGAFLATNGVGAAAIPGATWNAVNALERLGWAARGNCFVWNCQGGHSYPLDLPRRTLAVYSVAEFRSASAEVGYPGGTFDNAHCGRSVDDGRSTLWEASYLWSQYASQFRRAGFDYPQGGGLDLNPSPHSILSPSSLYSRVLLACTLSPALNERRP